MGIRDHPTAARSPWQSGHVERLIGSVRRQCLDHMIVFGEAHLRHILRAYASYYKGVRTHLSLDKGRPSFSARSAGISNSSGPSAMAKEAVFAGAKIWAASTSQLATVSRRTLS